MDSFNINKITKNVLALVEHSGASDIDFSRLLNISEKQYRLIKKGSAKLSIDDINRVCYIFKVTIPMLNHTEIHVKNNYRNWLASKHRESEFTIIFNKRPSLKYAIKFNLLDNVKFKESGLTVSEIKSVFASYGWNFTSRSISTALNRYTNLVIVKGIKLYNGKEIKVYQPLIKV